MAYSIHELHPSDFSSLIKSHVAVFNGSPRLSEDFLSSLHQQGRLRVTGLLPKQGDLYPAFLIAQTLGEQSEILDLAVLASFRRQGLARLLLNDLQAEGREILLEVRADNQPALQFYAAQGFVKTRRRQGYYQDGCDALEMSWQAD
ncbi:MAG: GNAT family N-acetyltransferase [Deltaproteobacteria bacterium]|nr:GNAT family N-acetyltransferase [Deltaproteobacteria bacterium]